MLRAASRTAFVAQRRAFHTPMSESIGNGKVIPLKFDELKPVYVPKSYTKQLVVLGWWCCSNHFPNMIMAATLIWAAHGGFSGHLPPDPHSLHP